MREIQMVDLHSQYLRIKDRVDGSILEVINSGAFINGPAVKSFQHNLAKYLECLYVQTCGNGTDALQIALMALGLQPGDEVVTTPFTFVATAEVIALLGLKIKFVDVEADTFNMDASQLEQAITPRTKCIIPVHLFGQAADMASLMDIANEHGLKVIEDNAQAIGASCKINGEWVKTGTIGHIGCLSFYPSKNLSCFGDGGALTTNDEDLYNAIRKIANHGSDKKYYHDSIGVNSRLDTIQAAILDIKLELLDTYTKARQSAAAAYDEGLKNIVEIELPKKRTYATHVYHQYTIKAHRRDELAVYLRNQGIPTMVYYPYPLHLQPAYLDSEFPKGSLPIAEKLCEEVISLPMHTELDEQQINHIIHSIKSFYQS